MSITELKPLSFLFPNLILNLINTIFSVNSQIILKKIMNNKEKPSKKFPNVKKNIKFKNKKPK